MAIFSKFRHDWGWLISCLPALGGFTYGYSFGLNGLVVVQVCLPAPPPSLGVSKAP